MEPNFGWPTHHHQELYLFYIFSQSECLFVYARPERLVDAKLLLGCDDLTSVYANDGIFSALVARVPGVMTAWECGHRQRNVVTRAQPARSLPAQPRLVTAHFHSAHVARSVSTIN